MAGGACCALCISLSASPVLQNPGFENNNFTGVTCTSGVAPCNVEFDVNFAAGKNVVSNWTSTGYAIYFIAGKQTTQNAAGQFQGSGLEKLSLPSTQLSSQGGNFVGLDGDPNASFNASLSQTVTGFTVGQRYWFAFDWAASELQSRSGITNEKINFKAVGAVTDLNFTSVTVTTPTQGFIPWRGESLSFVASSTTEVLTFLAQSTSTCLPPFVLLDGLTLSDVPEPGTIVLAGAGMAILMLLRFQKHRNRTS